MNFKLQDCFLSYDEVEQILETHKDVFKAKRIYCIPSNIYIDNIVRYLVTHFDELELEELVVTNYPTEIVKKIEIDRGQPFTRNRAYYIRLSKVNSFDYYKPYIASCINALEDFSPMNFLQVVSRADVVLGIPPRIYVNTCSNIIQLFKKDFILLVPKGSVKQFEDVTVEYDNVGYRLNDKGHRVRNNRSHCWVKHFNSDK